MVQKDLKWILCFLWFAINGMLPWESVPAKENELVILRPVIELPRPGDSPTIIDGQKADPMNYPVSFQIAISKDEICTWFLVSERVLVTAAHCTLDKGSVQIDVKGGNKNADNGGISFPGKCDRSPKYIHDSSQDWALCLLEKSFPLPKNKNIRVIGYEVLNVDDTRLKLGDELQITGFGCTSPAGPVQKVYVIGKVLIDSLPPNAVVPGSTSTSPNLIQVDHFPSKLCGGDSGGPAFLVQDSAAPYIRIVVGVNSKTINKDGLGLGFISSSSTTDVANWIRKWSTENKQKICGLDADASNCRPKE
jgi:hypothetical protein